MKAATRRVSRWQWCRFKADIEILEAVRDKHGPIVLGHKDDGAEAQLVKQEKRALECAALQLAVEFDFEESDFEGVSTELKSILQVA